MSPLRRWVVRLGFAGAVLGPFAGAAALWFGNLALWGADVPDELPDVIYAGVLMGTVPTVACIGLMVASPLRLIASIGMHRGAWWGWPLLALTAVVGLADLSLGIVHTALIMALWGKEGPAGDERQTDARTRGVGSGDNLGPPSAPEESTPSTPTT